MEQIDFDAIKRSADIVAITGVSLKGNRSEYAGPCPFCGGTDRFHVRPKGKHDYGVWFCRNCTNGEFKDVIDFYAKRENVSKIEAAKAISNGDVPMKMGGYTPPIAVAKTPPEDLWQQRANAIIQKCHEILWNPEGQEARQWLSEVKGLSEETIRHFRLGFCPGGYDKGRKIAGEWVWGGIIVPCIANGRVWYVKSRRVWGAIPNCGDDGTKRDKYRHLKGGIGDAIFNYDDLKGKSKAVLCEGELDAMLCWQELQNTAVGVISLGSQSNVIDLVTWGQNLLPLVDMGVLLDCDGKSDGGAAKLESMSQIMHRINVPVGKDPSSFRSAGGNIRRWLTNEMGLAPIVVEWPTDTKVSLPKRTKVMTDGRIEAHYRSRLELAESILPLLEGDECVEVAAAIEAEKQAMGVQQ